MISDIRSKFTGFTDLTPKAVINGIIMNPHCHDPERDKYIKCSGTFHAVGGVSNIYIQTKHRNRQ